MRTHALTNSFSSPLYVWLVLFGNWHHHHCNKQAITSTCAGIWLSISRHAFRCAWSRRPGRLLQRIKPRSITVWLELSMRGTCLAGCENASPGIHLPDAKALGHSVKCDPRIGAGPPVPGDDWILIWTASCIVVGCILVRHTLNCIYIKKTVPRNVEQDWYILQCACSKS